MSKQLLLSLNGSNRGAFYQWLSKHKGNPRIAWYPSAGEDLRDLLYLSSSFAQRMPAMAIEPSPPDLFLHTDYFPWSTSSFLDSNFVYQDSRTTVLIKSIEELPRYNLPLDSKIVDFPDGSHATGRVLFLQIEVSSHVLGNFSVPLIYAFIENSVFCSQCIIPNGGKISHVIHIRYGGGCGGGGKSSGIWLLNILRNIECECFVTDGHCHTQSGDERAMEIYPNLAATEALPNLEPIRVIPSKSWSCHGNITWNVLKK